LGDVAFLHDAGGLLGLAGLGVSLVFVVIDNGGGGIFDFLPVADVCEPDEFARVFTTEPPVAVDAVASAYGIAVETVDRAGAIAPAIGAAIAAGGPRVVHVRTDRSRNVALHRDVWSAVAAALR